ncbi:MAG: hypothetical protein J6W11_01275, partial [Alphaproteobacteria bacterium]|nr:hypothetical protein [Alphaproteobacteria bacterium]
MRKIWVFLFLGAMCAPFTAQAKVCFLPSVFGGDEYCLSDEEAAQYEGCRGFEQTVPCLPGQEQLSCTHNGKTYYHCYCRKDTYTYADHPEYRCKEGYTEECGCIAQNVECAPEYMYRGDGFGHCKDYPRARGVDGCVLPNGEVFYKSCTCSEQDYPYECRETGLKKPQDPDMKCVAPDGSERYSKCYCDAEHGWSPNECKDQGAGCTEPVSQVTANAGELICSQCKEVACGNENLTNIETVYCDDAGKVTYSCEALGYTYAPNGTCPAGTRDAGKEGVRCPFDRNFMNCDVLTKCAQTEEQCKKNNVGATKCERDETIELGTKCWTVTECDESKGYISTGLGTCMRLGCSEGYQPGLTAGQCSGGKYMGLEKNLDAQGRVRYSGGEECAKCVCKIPDTATCYYTSHKTDTTEPIQLNERVSHMPVYIGYNAYLEDKCCNGYYATCHSSCEGDMYGIYDKARPKVLIGYFDDKYNAYDLTGQPIGQVNKTTGKVYSGLTEIGSARKLFDVHATGYTVCEACGQKYYTLVSCEEGYAPSDGQCVERKCDTINGYRAIKDSSECETNGGLYKGKEGWDTVNQADPQNPTNPVQSGDIVCKKCVCNASADKCKWSDKNKDKDGELKDEDLCCNGYYKDCHVSESMPKTATEAACQDAKATSKKRYKACGQPEKCVIEDCISGYDLINNKCIISSCPVNYDTGKQSVNDCGSGSGWSISVAEENGEQISQGGKKCTKCECTASADCKWSEVNAGKASLGDVCCNGLYKTCISQCAGVSNEAQLVTGAGADASQGVANKETCKACGNTTYIATACRTLNGYVLKDGKCEHQGCPAGWWTEGSQTCSEGEEAVAHEINTDNGHRCMQCQVAKCAAGYATDELGCATETVSSMYWKVNTSKKQGKSGSKDCYKCEAKTCVDMGGKTECDPATENSTPVTYFDGSDQTFKTDCSTCTEKTKDEKCSYAYGNKYFGYEEGKKCGTAANGGVAVGVFKATEDGCFTCSTCAEAGEGYYSSQTKCPKGYTCEYNNDTGCYMIIGCANNYYENDCAIKEHGNEGWDWTEVVLEMPYATPKCGSCAAKQCPDNLSASPQCAAGREVVQLATSYSGSATCGSCVCAQGYGESLDKCGETKEVGWKFDENDTNTCKECKVRTCEDYGYTEDKGDKKGYVKSERKVTIGDNTEYSCYEYLPKEKCDGDGVLNLEACGVGAWKLSGWNGDQVGEEKCYNCEPVRTTCPEGTGSSDDMSTCGANGALGWELTETINTYKNGDEPCYTCKALKCEDNYVINADCHPLSEIKVASSTRYNGANVCYTCVCNTPNYQSDAANCGTKGDMGGWKFNTSDKCNYCSVKDCTDYGYEGLSCAEGYEPSAQSNEYLGDEQKTCVTCQVKRCAAGYATPTEGCGDYRKLNPNVSNGKSGEEICYQCVCNNDIGYYEQTPTGARVDSQQYDGCVKPTGCADNLVISGTAGLSYFNTTEAGTFNIGSTSATCYAVNGCNVATSTLGTPTAERQKMFEYSYYELAGTKCYYPTDCKSGYLRGLECNDPLAGYTLAYEAVERDTWIDITCRLCREKSCHSQDYYNVSGTEYLCPADRTCILETTPLGSKCNQGQACATTSDYVHPSVKDVVHFKYGGTNVFGRSASDMLDCVELTGCNTDQGSYDSKAGVANYLHVVEGLVNFSNYKQGTKECFTGVYFCNNDLEYYDTDSLCVGAYVGRKCVVEDITQCYIKGLCDNEKGYWDKKTTGSEPAANCLEAYPVGHICLFNNAANSQCYYKTACNGNRYYTDEQTCESKHTGRTCSIGDNTDCYVPKGCDTEHNYWDTDQDCVSHNAGWLCNDDNVEKCFVKYKCDNTHCDATCSTETVVCPSSQYPFTKRDHADMHGECQPISAGGTFNCSYDTKVYESFTCHDSDGWKYDNKTKPTECISKVCSDFDDYKLAECPTDRYVCLNTTRTLGSVAKQCYKLNGCNATHCGQDCATTLDACEGFPYSVIAHATMTPGAEHKCDKITKTNDTCNHEDKYDGFTCNDGWKKNAAGTACIAKTCADYPDFPDATCRDGFDCSHEPKNLGDVMTECYVHDKCDSSHCGENGVGCATELNACAGFPHSVIANATMNTSAGHTCDKITKTADKCVHETKYNDFTCNDGWKKNAAGTACVAKTCADYTDYPDASCSSPYVCNNQKKNLGGVMTTCYVKTGCDTNHCNWTACDKDVKPCSTYPYNAIAHATMGNACAKRVKNGEACADSTVYDSFTCNTGWKVSGTSCIEKHCSDYNKDPDNFPEDSCDANCFICTSKSEPTGDKNTTCWHKENKVCSTYTGWMAANERSTDYFTYESDQKCTGAVNGVNTNTTCYKVNGCNAANGYLPSTEVSADIFIYDEKSSGGYTCRKALSCKESNNWFNYDKLGQYKGIYFNLNEDTKSGVACYKVSGCSQYAYSSQPDTTYFKSTKFDETYSNGKKCWIMTGMADYAYASAELPKFFAYENQTAYLNGTSTQKTYYRVKQCAQYAYDAQPSSKYFTSSSQTRKKLGTSTDITCWNVTGKTNYAYEASGKETRYFAYDSGVTRYLNGTSTQVTYYNVTGCASSASNTSQNTTIYVVRDKTQYLEGTSTTLKCYSPESCNKGYKQATASNNYGFSCTICPTGSYNDTAGSATCTSCSAGTYSAAQGATSVSTCTKCVAGKWSTAGASQCTNCADGKWSTEGRGSQCVDDCEAGYSCKDGSKTKCGVGTWAGAGQSACTQCVAGTYSTALGATSVSTCTNCAAGKWSNAGRGSQCTDNCEAGYACKNGAKTQCVAGTYALAGQSTCTNCAAGKWSTAGRTT